MANLRILSNNVGDLATVTGTNSVGTLVASNVQNDLKSSVWRATGYSNSLTFVWTVAQHINMVAIPYCNLSNNSSIRITGFTLSTDTTPVYDSGTLSFPGVGTGMGVNTFSYGGGATGVFYFSSVNVQKIVLTFTDSGNSATYTEYARVCMGTYLELATNAEYGTAVQTIQETTTSERSSAGDLRQDVGVMYKKLSFQLPWMTTSDRDSIWNILRSNGMRTGIFVDVIPVGGVGLEQSIYSLYGKLTKNCALTYTYYNQTGITIELEEI